MDCSPVAPTDQAREALRLIGNGISIIPIGKNKVPSISWKEYCSRIATGEEVESWFSNPSGIGRVCGAVSGNLLCIDIDDNENPLNTAHLIESWYIKTCDQLEIQPISFADHTSITETPRPGYQINLRSVDPVPGNQKLASSADGNVIIETRGEGGYALCPGSASFCHPKGAENYRHVAGVELADLKPAWNAMHVDILLMACKFQTANHNFSNPIKMKEAENREINKRSALVSVPSQLPDKTSPADDFIARASWAEILEPHGFVNVGTDGQSTRWKRPGTENPVSATTDHDGSNLFYAFSPNCHPALETNRGYNKLAVYAALNFGDHSEESFRLSVKHLASDGFGSKDLSPQVDISKVMEKYAQNENNSSTHDFQLIQFNEYLKQDDQVEYLCQDIIARGQDTIIGGPAKSLKTGTSFALAYAMASSSPFLGKFECRRRVRTGILTGESSRAKNKNLLQAIQKSSVQISLNGEGFDETPIPLFISHRLPIFSDPLWLDSLKRMIDDFELEVLFIDPAYLCLGEFADFTGNVAKMGNVLRSIKDIGGSTGCTLIINHHTNRKFEPGRSLDLSHLSGAGWAEWVRQWILVNPRTEFDHVNHIHKLWMVTGGSDGHAGKFAVDVCERDDAGEWLWQCEVKSQGQEVSEYKERQQEQREADRQARESEFSNCLKLALQAGGADGSTLREIKQQFTDNGWSGVSRITSATISDFIEYGFAKSDEAPRGNGQKVTVYLPDGSWSESCGDQGELITGFQVCA